MKRSAQVFLTVCFLLVLAAVPALILLKGAGTTASYYENRSLAARPVLTAGSLLDGSYFSGWDAWLTDHVGGRTPLLKLQTFLDMDILRRPVVNGEVVSAGVLLPYYEDMRWDLGYLTPLAADMADQLAAFDALVEDCGGKFYYVGLPHQSDYFSDRYPGYLSSRAWHVDAMSQVFSAALAERGVTFWDIGADFDAQGHPDRYYSATDHHFTYEGARAAYRAILERINEDAGLGLAVLQDKDLILTELPNPYLGSQNRKLYGLWPDDEALVTGTPVQDIPFTRWDNGTQVPSTLFDLPADDTSAVTYNLYMGGDVAETVIDTGREELPDLLIFGDSFTNPLETLLYASFNVTRCIDLRYYDRMTLAEYVSRYEPDVVLCVRDNTAYFTADGNGSLGVS